MSAETRDRRLLYGAVFLRATATGLIAVLLGLYLAQRGLDSGRIELIVGAGLAGAALGALLVTLWGDRVGRRTALIAFALLSAAGAVALCLASETWMLAGVAFAGMVNGMGRDRGAALILEQAILPGTTPDSGRTFVFARYNLLQDAGLALGGLLAGSAGRLESAGGVAALDAQRISIAAGAVLLLVTALLYLLLSPRTEEGAAAAVAAGARGLASLSASSRRIVLRLSALFAVDAVGGGFLTTAWLSYFFAERFGLGAGALGLLFGAARLLNALSHLGAAWLARRIGLVNTMVFTHMPSSLLLVTVAFAPTFPIAAALYLLREGLVEMDVPTRQSYVMALVRPEERTVASGVTHLVRLVGWAIAPFLAWMMSSLPLVVPLVIGAMLKLTYDVLLWMGFRSVRPPEERAA